MNKVACVVCAHVFEQEHPRQTVCRVCVTPRCPVCCWHMTDAPLDAVYCSHRCRQRARAGSRYTLLGRDNYTCARCVFVGDEDNPASMRRLTLFSWGNPRTAANTVTMCRSCSKTSVFSDLVTQAWERANRTRNEFFKIDNDQPMTGLSRGEMRRRKRRTSP